MEALLVERLGARKVQELNKILFSDWGPIYMSEHSAENPNRVTGEESVTRLPKLR